MRNEEIKAHAVETKPSLRLGSTIEWKSPKGVMKGVKKCLPIDSKVSSASVEKEYQMGELVSNSRSSNKNTHALDFWGSLTYA